MRDESSIADSGMIEPVVGPVSDGPEDAEAAKRALWKRRVTLVSGIVTLIAAAVVLPPLINVSRYQHKVTALMTRALGRPVRLSSVELRLLPRPGFVLHDLSVSEDPAFGAEPILSARTVVASVRLVSLWRGRPEVSRISVDEASLNLVRSAQGRWNLESLMIGAQPALTGRGASPGASNLGANNPAANPGQPAAGISAHFPYLEATNSRVNLKNGVEKSPYSLVSTDLSLWQDEPGQWRVRLRGQPVRTDLEMSLADTGEVRMEATLHSAATLREMPLRLQMEWRDAQLGQLSRLMLGSDAGWRGGVTADIDVVGSPESALTKARLRAVGVRRQEFAPETPLDFDANCAFRYQHSLNAFHDLGCDTAIGDGRLHLKAELPGAAGKPEAMLEVKQIPVQAGLDLLRTLRSGFAPGISVRGTVNGSLTYKEVADGVRNQLSPAKRRPRRQLSGKGPADGLLPSNLQGKLVLDGVVFEGGGLKESLTLPQVIWSPAPIAASTMARNRANGDDSTGLTARLTIPLAPAVRAQPVTSQPGTSSASAPAQSVVVALGLDGSGYNAEFSGAASIARLRDLAYAFGLPHLDAADGFADGMADFDLAAHGPWISPGDVAAEGQSSASGRESLSGSLQLHRAEWQQPYLAQPVELPQASVAISDAGISFTADFSYGGSKVTGDAADASKDGLRGSVIVNAPLNCKAGGSSERSSQGPGETECLPQVQLRFGGLDAAAVEAALLGAPAQKTLFSPLIDRMRSSDRAKWPEVAATIQADSLVLGPATLQKPSIRMRFKPNEAEIEDWEVGFLGGSAKGTGSFARTADKPEYSLSGTFTHLSAASLGALLDSRWTGGPVNGSGSIQLSGLTAKELAASAAGDLRFDWRHGAFPAAQKDAPEAHFDEWSGTVAIQGGKAQIGENALLAGRRSWSVAGAIPFGGPAKLTVTPSGSRLAARPVRLGESASLPAAK